MFEFDQNRETIENLRHLLNHPAWKQFFIPKLISTREAAIQALLDPSAERSSAYPDDFLRAQVQTINAFLSVGQAALDAYDDEKRREAQAHELEKEYAERRDLGLTGHIPEAPTAERS